MFDGLNDEDDFFTPVSSSNLASLFGVTITQANIGANTTLTYTAPKQPSLKNDEALNNSKIKHQNSVLLFKEVHAFKLVEKNYLNQGKCGLALIGNDTLRVYQLLLYKQKNDIISSSKICNFFQFIIQKDNYTTFCDDQKQNWTIHFNTQAELNEFSFTLESRDAKIVTTNETNETINSITPGAIFTHSTLDKESSKQFTSSDTQSDVASSTVKANILTRMAKMGQKLLPNTSISDGTDSDTEKDKSLYKNRKSNRGTTALSSLGACNTVEITKPQSNLISNQTQSPTYMQPITQFAMINGQPIPIITPQISTISNDKKSHSVLPVENISSAAMYSQMIPNLSYDQFQMYFAENRTHNSEVRMNILRLTNKMEEVLHKVQIMDKNATDNKDANLKDENEKLKLIIKKLEHDLETNLDAQKKRNKEFLDTEQIMLKENEDLKKSIEFFRECDNSNKKKIDELEMKLKEYDEASSKESQDQMLKNENKFNDVEDIIKKIMNNLYREINEHIPDDGSAEGRDVKKILAQKIVDNTYNIITAVSELSLYKPNAKM